MEVGTKVWIHAMGSYYAGEVVKLTAQRATVRYTSGAGKVREKAVTKYELVDATGAVLRAVYHEKYQEMFPLVRIEASVPAPRGARQLSTAEKGPNIYEQAQAARAQS